MKLKQIFDADDLLQFEVLVAVQDGDEKMTHDLLPACQYL